MIAMLLLCACGKKSEVSETDGAGLLQMETPEDGEKIVEKGREVVANGEKVTKDSGASAEVSERDSEGLEADQTTESDKEYSTVIADSENDQQSTRNADGAKHSEQVDSSSSEIENSVSISQIYVYICGAVVTPDVYALPEGSRVYEAVQLAGGLADDADADQVNLAVVLSDGQKVRIPRKGEKLSAAQMLSDGSAGIYGGSYGAESWDTGVSDGGSDGMGSTVRGAGSGVAGSGGLVNINTAGKEALMTLSGIGSTRAEAIIRYREIHGAFQSPRDLLKVSGIKEKTYEKIKGQISIE